MTKQGRLKAKRQYVGTVLNDKRVRFEKFNKSKQKLRRVITDRTLAERNASFAFAHRKQRSGGLFMTNRKSLSMSMECSQVSLRMIMDGCQTPSFSANAGRSVFFIAAESKSVEVVDGLVAHRVFTTLQFTVCLLF